jgi:hypothetical protein
MRHSAQSIKRYVSTFLRIVILHREGAPESAIAFVTQTSERLVKDYLKVYRAALNKEQWKEKLEEEVARVSAWQRGERAGPEVSQRVEQVPEDEGEKKKGEQR